MSSMSQSQTKSTASQEQTTAPQTSQQAPQSGMGNGAAVEEAGIEGGQGQSPLQRLNELLAEEDSDPDDVAFAYVEMNAFNKEDVMMTREGELRAATQGSDVAWSLIESAFRSAIQPKVDAFAQEDGALQDAMASFAEAAMADYSAGLREMASLNFLHEELKYEDKSLSTPSVAPRTVRVGADLARAIGCDTVTLSHEGSMAEVHFSDLEIGTIVSNQTAQGEGQVLVTASAELGSGGSVRNDVDAKAPKSVIYHLPNHTMSGVPVFEG